MQLQAQTTNGPTLLLIWTKGAGGVAVTQVLPGGAAAQVGIQSGMVILEVNQVPVNSVADVEAAMVENEKQVLLLMEYQGSRRFVVLDLTP